MLEQRAFLNFQDELRTAATDEDFVAATNRFATAIGYRWFAYFSTGDEFKVVTSYPTQWQSRYFAKRYDQTDPVVKIAKQSNNVFSWDAKPLTKTGADARFFGEAADIGIMNGIVIPLQAGFGRRANLTFSGPYKDGLSLNERYATELVQLAALYFDAFYNASAQKRAQPATTLLTPRERLCLTWIAEGKTLAEAAKILNLSERTMLHHTSNIRRKLSAMTLPQAVGLALKYNEIKI